MKYRIVMEMDANEAYPADDIPCAKQNIFDLIKRIEMSLHMCKMDAMCDKALNEKLKKAALDIYDLDLKVADQLIRSMKITLRGAARKARRAARAPIPAARGRGEGKHE